MKVLAIVLLAVCVAGVASQADLHDLPEFPRLAEVDASTGVVAQGPDNNILNGKPLKVPIIVDPFAQEPGSDAAQELERIQSVLTMEPPSAAQPKAVAADQVDILEVLDRAAEAAKAKAKKAAQKKAQKDAAKAAAGNPAAQLALKNMKAVKKEISSLTDLIKKASDIQKELPQKKARLESLKKKLHAAAAKTAEKLAGKKAGAQSKVAEDVSGKIKTLKDKLLKLEQAKKLLHKSIDGLKKVASGQAVSPALIQEVEEAM
jgi:hypothetical protein